MMSRYKVKKSSLVIAAMVILLCLVSITGATFALFTSTSDGRIGVNTTSGKLKVDIIDDNSDLSMVGEVLNLVAADGREQEEILFEPGAAYYTEGFRVKNRGNIPLNFIIYISEDESRLDKELAEAFEVRITTSPDGRTEQTPLRQYEGRLEPGYTSDVYYLVFRMKETAGNEFNTEWQKPLEGIGITVCAVQGNGYVVID